MCLVGQYKISSVETFISIYKIVDGGDKGLKLQVSWCIKKFPSDLSM